MIHTESGGAGGPTSARYDEGGGCRGGWYPSRASQVAGNTNLLEKSDF